MEVKIAITKLFFAVVILWILGGLKENHADHGAFFARQKWTLETAHKNVFAVTGVNCMPR